MKYIFVALLVFVAFPIFASPMASIEATANWDYEITVPPVGQVHVGSTSINVYELIDMPRGLAAFYDHENKQMAFRALTALDSEVMHEAIHASYYILREQGISDFDGVYNQEVLAYTITDLTEQIESVLTKQFFLCDGNF